ncbi:MAG: AEC family transporter [Gammaproteobacteria bacterium]|nr:AEC family transporter [Gammaproteobacteria bacterium]
MGTIVFESLLPVFLVIAVGLGLRKSGLVPEDQWHGIELLGYWLLFPVLVLISLINMDLSNLDLGSISKGYLFAVILQIILVWLMRRPLHRFLGIGDRSFSSIFQTSTRWNGFIALAIAAKYAGDQGLAIVALIMAITVPVLNFVNIIVLTICASEQAATVRTTLINTLKVPLIWGALLGLGINLLAIPVYEPLMVGLDIVGRAGLGIGLLTVGAGIRIKAMLDAKTTVLIGIVAKLFIFPLLVFAGCMLFGVDGLALQVAMLSASVSTAMNGYILARKMGGDADLYAATASLQVVVSMFSIPFIFWAVSSTV